MAGSVVKRKRFFSARNEIRWLNACGQKGWRLWALDSGRYSFTVEQGKTFHYSMEWQDCALDSAGPHARIVEKADLGEPVCARKSLWLYFIGGRPVGLSKDALKKNRAHYRNPFLFFFFIAAICAGLAVYHYLSIPFLQEQGLTITVPTFTGSENPFLDLLLRLLYGLWQVVYYYFMLFGQFLGNTLATAVIAVLTPLFLVSFTVALVWGIEWIRWLGVRPRDPEKPEEVLQEEAENADAGEEEFFAGDPDAPDEELSPFEGRVLFPPDGDEEEIPKEETAELFSEEDGDPDGGRNKTGEDGKDVKDV